MDGHCRIDEMRQFLFSYRRVRRRNPDHGFLPQRTQRNAEETLTTDYTDARDLHGSEQRELKAIGFPR
jgi:hypothetical protein